MLNELQVLGKFGSQYKKCDGIKQICPHQSWRLMPYESYQIDILVTEKELNALAADQWLVFDDLWTLWMGGNQEGLNLNKREYCFKYHSPGNVLPRYEYYKKIDPVQAVDSTFENGKWGWWRTIKKYAGENYLIAAKNIGRRHQISVPIFIERAKW